MKIIAKLLNIIFKKKRRMEIDRIAKGYKKDREYFLDKIDFHSNAFVKNSFRSEIELYRKNVLEDREEKAIGEFRKYIEYYNSSN